ncbi:MAG: hypothetical protein ACOH18_03935 [Candidatus Saccharimonadaceae bacterium]
MNSTETTTRKDMNPRAKYILVILGSIGAVIIGALLVYGILVTPARQPYRDALTQYQNVGRANAMLTASGASLNAGKATGEEFEKNIKNAQAALKSLRIENEALAKQTVLKEGEGKARYDAYNAKLQTYMTYNENILTSMLKVRPVLFDCNQDMTDITESIASITSIRTCSNNLAKLDGIADSDYKQLVATFQGDYNNLADILEQIVALTDPQGTDKAQYDALVTQRTDALTQLSDTSTAFSKNVQQHRNDILTTDTEKKLNDYLKDKSRIF